MKSELLLPTLRFNGDICWICPHCGEENEEIRVCVDVRGLSNIHFSLEGDTVEAFDEFGALDGIEELDDFEITALYCPHCEVEVSEEDIRQGFKKWLPKLKKKNPKLYAKLAAQILSAANFLEVNK